MDCVLPNFQCFAEKRLFLEKAGLRCELKNDETCKFKVLAFSGFMGRSSW